MVAKALTNPGKTVWAWVMMCKAVVQTVLLHGSKSWVLTEAVLKVLERFQHRLDWIIAGM